MERRPRSAGRPRSAAGTTRTRSYFDSREGKTAENDEVDELPAPLFQPVETNDGEDGAPVFTLLGNLDEDGEVCHWDTTKVVKPQDQFVDEMQFSFAGINAVFNYLTGRAESNLQSGVLCDPSNSTFVKDDETGTSKTSPSRGPVTLLCNFIASFVPTSSGTTQNPGDVTSGEDGPIVSSSLAATKSRNLLRLEERIRREMSLEAKQADVAGFNEEEREDEAAIATPEKQPTSARIDDSFWASPGRELVGPEKRSGSVHQQIELCVRVEEIQFGQHPEMTSEEKELSRISALYEQYRQRIDANSFHYLVTRLTGLLQQVRAIHANTHGEGNECMKPSAEPLMIPLLDDVKCTSSNLLAESETIRNLSSHLKRGYDELMSGRETKGFTGADIELKTTALPHTELKHDVDRLLKETKSAKRALGRIGRSELYASTLPSIQFLEEVDGTLSNLQHITEGIELVHSSSDQSDGSITKEEKLRRRKISSEKYFARLLVNGTVVGDTKVGQLEWPSFAVKLSHRFNCKMSQKPAVTCVQLWKSAFGFVPHTLICACFHTIPEDGMVAEERLHFSSSRVADTQRRWKGTVLLSSSCKAQTVTHGDQRGPSTFAATIPRDDSSIFQQSKRLIRPPAADTEIRSCKKLEAITPSQRYPFCPGRQSMMAFKLPGSSIPFSDKSLLEEPLRHALIREREKNPAAVPSPIPMTELEVRNSDVYQDLLKEEGGLDAKVCMTLEQRAQVNKQHVDDIFRGLREYTQLKELRRRRHNLSQVIQDVGRLRFANDDEFEMPELLRQKRSLFPVTAKRLPIVSDRAEADASTKASLILTICSGKNVPTRVEADSMPQLETSGDGYSYPSLANGILAKINFRGQTYQTRAVTCGRSMGPKWKESICISLNEALRGHHERNETIDISLFDAMAIDYRQLGGYYEDEETTTSQLAYLGAVSVPVDAILREGSLGGFAYLDCPDIIVGYYKQSSSSSGANEESHHLPMMEPDRHNESSKSTRLLIHATTEPLTMIPPMPRPDFPSNESEKVTSLVEQWSERLNVGDGQCLVLWPDNKGNAFLVSRFLAEQEPPRGFDALASAAYYVSCIPTLDGLDWRDEHVVLKSQQFIDMMGGNRTEHAVLLANFFLHIEKRSAANLRTDVLLAIGFSIPEGRTTAWVVRRCRRNGEVAFWDATTGRSYLQGDDSCPLQKICFIASPENVYSNMERAKRPSLLDFDIGNTRKWAPLNPGGKLVTVQDDPLRFSPPDTIHAKYLQGELSDAIQDAIRGWRRTTTVFRGDLSSNVFAALEKLEQAKMTGQNTSGTDILPESIRKTRTAFGFTLHEPFISTQELLSRIEGTEIHRNRNARVEFVVAVRVFPLPGGIASVWVFVGSLVPLM